MLDKKVAVFQAVAREKSISEAARQLFITPQALTQQLNLLERDVGYRLFKRSTRGISLTAAGEVYLQGIQEMQSLQESLNAKVRMAASREERTIQLGIHTFLESPELLELAEAAQTRFPEILQKILPRGYGPGYLDTLEQEGHDIIQSSWSRDLEERGLRALILREETNFCVLPPDSPLRHKERIRLEDLAGKCILTHNRALWAELEADLLGLCPDCRFDYVHFDPEVDEPIRHVQEIREVTGGKVMIAPEFYTRMLSKLPKVPLDYPPVFLSSLIYRNHPSPPVQLFLQLARELFPGARDG